MAAIKVGLDLPPQHTCPGRLVHPQPDPGTLASELPENHDGWTKRPGQHLRHVLSAYVAHYNQARPHQGLGQRTPIPQTEPAGEGVIRRRELLGGLLREYYREAA